jgi:hypothetical protein
MAETLVKNRFCETCGVDVRLGSLFCYNCGGSVTQKKAVENDDKNNNGSESWFREDIASNGANHNKIGQKELEIEKDVKNNAATSTETVAEKFDEKKSIQEQTKLKSAASLRRQSKNLPRKKVEIIWEEPEAALNRWFIIAAIVLTLFTAGVVYLALHLR